MHLTTRRYEKRSTYATTILSALRPSVTLVRCVDLTMVDSTKVLCPLFYKIEILVPDDNPSFFPSLEKM